MLRNREFQIYLGASAAAAFIGAAAAALLFSFWAAALVLAVAALMVLFFFLFTKWRYRELEKLSGYLRRIAGGEYSLDVRDTREGELSILKNEIYKVTRMLSEHSSLLEKEKMNLTNAISDISHQLKTPLTSMMVMADLLGSEKLDAARRRE
ncbi:MAG: sensor histidine kinase, partial [Bacillales bacterium]